MVDISKATLLVHTKCTNCGTYLMKGNYYWYSDKIPHGIFCGIDCALTTEQKSSQPQPTKKRVMSGNKVIKSKTALPRDIPCDYCKHSMFTGDTYWYLSSSWKTFCSEACAKCELNFATAHGRSSSPSPANPPAKKMWTIGACVEKNAFCEVCSGAIAVNDTIYFSVVTTNGRTTYEWRHLPCHKNPYKYSTSKTKKKKWPKQTVITKGFNCSRCKLYVAVGQSYYSDPAGHANVCVKCHQANATGSSWKTVKAIYSFYCPDCTSRIQTGDTYQVNTQTNLVRCNKCGGATKQMSTGARSSGLRRFDQSQQTHLANFKCGGCQQIVAKGNKYWFDTQVLTSYKYCTETCAMQHNGVNINMQSAGTPTTSSGKRVTAPINCTCHKCGGYVPNGDIIWVDKIGDPYCDTCHQGALKKSQPTKRWMQNVATMAGMPCPSCGTNSQVGDTYYTNPKHQAKPHWLCETCYTNTGAAVQPAQTMGQTVMSWQNYTVNKGATCGDCGTRIGRGQQSYRKRSSGGVQFRCLHCKPAVLGAPNALYDGVIDTGQTTIQPTIKCIDLGTAPKKEQVACFGGRHYDERVQRELDIWEPYLIGKFGTPPRGAAFSRKIKQHAAGREITLWLDYDDNIPDARKYANDVLTNLPEYYAAPKTTNDAGQTQQQAQAAAPAGILVDSAGKQWQSLTKNSDLKARPCASCGHRPLKGEDYFDGGKGKGNLRCGNCPPN